MWFRRNLSRNSIIIKHREFIIESIFLLFLSLIIVYNWFGDPTKYVLYYVDQFFPANPSFFLSHISYAWTDLRGTGGPTFFGTGLLPYIGSMYLLTDFHFGLPLSQYIIYSLLSFATMESMLLFSYKIYDEELKRCHAPLFSSVLYFANTYILKWVIGDFKYIWFAYAILPVFLLSLYLVVTELKDGRIIPSHMFILPFFIYLMIPALSWAWFIPIFFIAGLYWIVLSLSVKPGLKKFLLLTGFMMLESIMLYSTQLLGVTRILSTVSGDFQNVLWGWVVGNSANTSYLTAFAISWRTSSYSAEIMLISLLLPLFSSIAVLRKSQSKVMNLHAYFFMVLVILFVPLIVGYGGPFASAFRWAWENLIFFRGFVTLLMDFGFVLTLSYSFLVPIGVYLIAKHVAEHISIRTSALGIVTMIIILGTASPMFTGSWAQSFPPGWGPGARVEIPPYEYNLYNFLHGNILLGQRVLQLPIQGPLTASTSYLGTNLLTYMGLPIFSDAGSMSEQANEIYSKLGSMIGNQSYHLSHILSVLGIKFVVIYSDLNEESFEGIYPTSNITSILLDLNNTQGLRYVTAIGPRIIYEVNATYPIVYATAPGQYTFPQDPPEVSTSPTITLISHSPVEYVVSIHNATQPYLLVLGVTYDSGWVASIGGVTVPEANHMEVYGYANGWLVNRTGSYEVNIFYKPQLAYSTAVILQFLALAVPFAFLAYTFIKWKLSQKKSKLNSLIKRISSLATQNRS